MDVVEVLTPHHFLVPLNFFDQFMDDNDDEREDIVDDCERGVGDALLFAAFVSWRWGTSVCRDMVFADK